MPTITIESKFDIGDIYHYVAPVDSLNKNKGFRIHTNRVMNIGIDGIVKNDIDFPSCTLWVNGRLDQESLFTDPERAVEACLNKNRAILRHLEWLEAAGHPPRSIPIHHGGK